jgi:hypothetical protein
VKKLLFPAALLALSMIFETGCLVATDTVAPKSEVATGGASRSIACPIFPPNDVWNTPIDQMLVDEHSSAYLENMESQGHLHAGFGSGRTGEWGSVYMIADGNTPRVTIPLTQVDDSDRGMMPVPKNPPLEHSPTGVLSVLDPQQCLLYEYSGLHKDADGEWNGTSAAVFDLRSHILRRTGTMSADQAGMPIFPGLVRYEEVAAGSITHALRFSTPRVRKMFIWPARHAESNIYDSSYPPLGARFRLKANFPINHFSPAGQVILRALQSYGMFLADIGGAWTISGAPDPRWNDMQLAELDRVPASAFEMVDEQPLVSDVNLGIARQDVRPGDLPTAAAPDAPAAPAGSTGKAPGSKDPVSPKN